MFIIRHLVLVVGSLMLPVMKWMLHTLCFTECDLLICNVQDKGMLCVLVLHVGLEML